MAGLPPYVRQLAPGYLLGVGLGAVVLDVMVFLTTGQYFGVHLRYGLALFPLGLAFAALLLRTRTAARGRRRAPGALRRDARRPRGLDSIAM